MNIFGWRTEPYQTEALAVGCKISDAYVQCSLSEASRNAFTCTIPSSRIQSSLMDLLNRPLSIRADNTFIEGTLDWYTIEDSFYRIGITIAKKDRKRWRKLLEEKSGGSMHVSARPAAV